MEGRTKKRGREEVRERKSEGWWEEERDRERKIEIYKVN